MFEEKDQDAVAALRENLEARGIQDLIPGYETVQEILLNRITGGKPLRVWLVYWVPAFAGMTGVVQE